MQTRFPPEPNGYLHIGHAKAIAMDFGVARKFGGVCNLRMDDTNPQKEDMEYVRAIERDIEWLGFKWGKVVYASDYFQELWDFAVWCIKTGRAYVDEQTSEQIAAQKGTPTTPGVNSPYRDRPIEESLALFQETNSGNMEPVYHDGQIVWVQQCESLAIGQVGVFIYDGEGYLKVYSEQEPDVSVRDDFTDSYGEVRMQPVMLSYNQDYAPRAIVPGAAFRVVGRVL